MRKTIKYLGYLSFPLLYLFASNVFAGVFDPPPSDKSIEFLGTIFGSNVGTIYLGGPVSPVISAMFEKFNIVIVAIGTTVVSYIGIVSTINTAQEGQTMGKKWSSIWLPLRSMMGMLLMVPAPASGFSMIQVTVLWAILQGIGAADQVWEMVLDFLSQGISATSGVQVDPSTKTQLEDKGLALAKQMLNSAICLESIKKISDGIATDDSTPPKTIVASDFITKYGAVTRVYQTSPPIVDITQDPITYTAYLNVGAKNPTETGTLGKVYATMCGSYEVSSSINRSDLAALGLSGSSLDTEANQRALDALDTKFLALNTMFSTLKPIAEKIVNGEAKDRDGFRLKDGVKPSPGGYIDMARDSYVTIMQGIIKPAVAGSAVLDAVDKGKRGGWITAGSFYFVLNAAQQQTLLPTALIPPKVSQYAGGGSTDLSVPSCPKGSQTGKCDGSRPDSYYSDGTNGPKTLVGIKDYITTVDSCAYIAKRLLDGNVYSANDSSTNLGASFDLSGVGGDGAALFAPLQELSANAIKWLSDEMSNSSGDPLLGIASFGSRLMLAAEITWLVIAAVAIGLAAASVMSCASPVFMIIVTIITTIIPVILAIMGALWTCGATLAVYVPMVPYMIYTVTALGWFLLVVEAIIAAPIVSLGFVIPSGEELGKVVPGLMLLVSIVLRPTLMVFGFILAARLFRAVVALVNFGMADTFKTIPTTGSLLAPVAAMCLYGGFIIALVNKSFALIYIVPDKVLRWIGGPTEQTDASAAHEAKQSMDKGAQVAKGMGESLAKGGSDSASKLNDKKGQEVASANNSAKSEAGQAARHKELMGALKDKGGADAVSGAATGGTGGTPPIPGKK